MAPFEQRRIPQCFCRLSGLPAHADDRREDDRHENYRCKGDH
jgi:hypothetical protein